MNSLSFYEECLNEILQQLVDSRQLEPNQESITKFVIDNAYNSLSERQRNTFNYMIGTIKDAKSIKSTSENKKEVFNQMKPPSQENM